MTKFIQQLGDLVRTCKRYVAIACKDESFLSAISRVENIVSKIMAIALLLVIFISLYDLLRFLAFEVIPSEVKGGVALPLLKIFGMFLNVLIALELMENVTAYLRHHSIQLELVIITALTAVARKIVIFDSKADGDLGGFAIAVLCLSISYWIVSRQGKMSK
jgi:uncharacterized membrane protein (DUF373 family)